MIDATPPEGDPSLSSGVFLLQDDDQGDNKPPSEEPRQTVAPAIKFKGKPSKSLMLRFKVIRKLATSL
jgi:hypothetical protein